MFKLCLDVICGRDPHDSTTVETERMLKSPSISLSQLRVGIPVEYHPKGLSDEVLDAWDQVAGIFEKAGSSVNKVLKILLSKYTILQCNLFLFLHTVL